MLLENSQIYPVLNLTILKVQSVLLVSKPIEKQFGFKTMDVSGLANGNYIISVGNRGIKGFTKQISIIH